VRTEGRKCKKTLDNDGRIILKWILEKQDWVLWSGFIVIRIGIDGGFCELRNKPSGSIK
jgi:hypothetical protein